MNSRSDINAKPYKTAARLFVAGLPTNVDPDQVLRFFEAFGEFTLAPANSVREAETLRKKGHAILVCRSAHVASELVKTRHYIFLGRRLTVLPLKTGKQLIIENSRANAFRVILKRIPKEYSSENLRGLLEMRYGPLNTLFCYKPDEGQLHAKNWGGWIYRDFDSYSAIFECKEHAKTLIQQGKLDLGKGVYAVAEKFRLKSKVSKPTQFLDSPFGFPTQSSSPVQNIMRDLPEMCQANIGISQLDQVSGVPRIVKHCVRPTKLAYFYQPIHLSRPHQDCWWDLETISNFRLNPKSAAERTLLLALR